MDCLGFAYQYFDAKVPSEQVSGVQCTFLRLQPLSTGLILQPDLRVGYLAHGASCEQRFYVPRHFPNPLWCRRSHSRPRLRSHHLYLVYSCSTTIPYWILVLCQRVWNSTWWATRLRNWSHQSCSRSLEIRVLDRRSHLLHMGRRPFHLSPRLSLQHPLVHPN